jgi:hypothetical protein
MGGFSVFSTTALEVLDEPQKLSPTKQFGRNSIMLYRIRPDESGVYYGGPGVSTTTGIALTADEWTEITGVGDLYLVSTATETPITGTIFSSCIGVAN